VGGPSSDPDIPGREAEEMSSIGAEEVAA
jgi:hypothetical protein